MALETASPGESMIRNTIVCTVGTSLLTNLKRFREEGPDAELSKLLDLSDWESLGAALAELDASTRLCGAEINSNHSAIARGHAAADSRVVLLYSDTEEGRAVARLLLAFYRARSNCAVESRLVSELQDADSRRFRTTGLRNLAKEICRALTEFGESHCVINATGGYKGQVAIAVLLGQAMQVPVFYKHELFDEIVSFPPMPVALDVEAWQRHSGLLYELERSHTPFLFEISAHEEYEELLESLIERTEIDGRTYIELSPVGTVFHQAFQAKLPKEAARGLPPAIPAEQKKPPKLEDAGWPGAHPEVEAFMRKVTRDVPQVQRCRTHYFNPSLASWTRFRLAAMGVECVFSNGTFTAKFSVDSRADSRAEEEALVAELNRWYREQG